MNATSARRHVVAALLLVVVLGAGERAEACSYTVSVPGASDIWTTGSSASIRWFKSGICSDRVDIDLLREGEWVTTIAGNQPNNGSASWLVPSYLRSALEYQVRVTDRDDGSIGLSREFIISNAAYCGYRVTQPAAGDVWYVGSNHSVRWNRAGTCPSPVDLFLLQDGVVVDEIATRVSDSGSYNWLVPADQEPGSDYMIQIRDSNDANSYDRSDAFSLAEPPACSYQVVEPTAATTWRMGETYDIEWTSSDGCAESVDLDLLLAGAEVASIASALEDSGSTSWLVPTDLEASGAYQVRVAATADPTRSDVSPEFSIESSVEPPQERLYWIETAAHLSGQAGSVWRTDIVARNLSEAESEISIRLRGAGGGTLASVIPGGALAVFEDVLGLMDVDGKGWLEITSDRPLLVSGRIYNVGADGTFGQYLEGYEAGGGLAQGPVGTLLQLRQLEGEFRTNLGFTNPNPEDAVVRVTLFEAGGTELLQYQIEVSPRALVQDLEPYARRASRPDLGWGFAEVEVLDGGPVLVSASVVDSRTNDATTVPVKTGTGDR